MRAIDIQTGIILSLFVLYSMVQWGTANRYIEIYGRHITEGTHHVKKVDKGGAKAIPILGIIAVAVLLISGERLQTALLCGIAIEGLLLAAVVDIEIQLIPDRATTVIAISMFCLYSGSLVYLVCYVIAVIALLAIIYGLYVVYGGAQVGYGDLKLLAVLLGLLKLPMGQIALIYISIVVALSFEGMAAALSTKKYSEWFAFGPYLALGGIVALLCETVGII